MGTHLLYCRKGRDAFVMQSVAGTCCACYSLKLFARKQRRSAQTLCSQKRESTACWPQILPHCYPPAVPSCVTWTEVLCFFMGRKVFLGSVCSHVAHSHSPYTSCSEAGSHLQWKHLDSGEKTDFSLNLTIHRASCVPTTSYFIYICLPHL